MKNTVKKIVSEPLVHFLLLGALIYMYYVSVQETRQDSSNKPVIVITKEDIQQLKEKYASLFFKKPTSAILDALIQKQIQNKVLLNEAYALALDKETPQTKEELLNKMNFIIDAESAAQEPSEKQLKEYYLENIKDYSNKTSFSFYTLHFNNLNETQNNYFYNLLQFSDKEKIAQKIDNKPIQWLKKEFGNYFVQQLLFMKKGLWYKAVHSKNGMEFVYVTDYQTSSALPFDDVQERVYNDYKNELRKKNYDKIYTTLLHAYSVHVRP